MRAIFARMPSRGCSRLFESAAVGLACVGLFVATACTSAQGADKTRSSVSVSSAAASTPSPSASVAASSASSTTSGSAKPKPTSPQPSKTTSKPSTGGIHVTVASRPRKTLPPLPLSRKAEFGTGVTAKIVSIDAVQAEAHGPGEVAGPGLKIVVEVTNGTAKAISLDAVVITVYDSEDRPGVQMSMSGSDPMRGSLAAGKSAKGTYVFTLSPDHRNPVTVNFSYSSEAPVVLFVGKTA